MLNSLEPLLNTLPPKTAQALTQAINKCGQALGMAPEWVQRWIAFTIVADALAAYAPDGEPAFHFKGGAAIELRLRQLRPRTDAAPTSVQPGATEMGLDMQVAEEIVAHVTQLIEAIATVPPSAPG